MGDTEEVIESFKQALREENVKNAAITGAVSGAVSGILAGIIIGIFICCCLKGNSRPSAGGEVYTYR